VTWSSSKFSGQAIGKDCVAVTSTVAPVPVTWLEDSQEVEGVDVGGGLLPFSCQRWLVAHKQGLTLGENPLGNPKLYTRYQTNARDRKTTTRQLGSCPGKQGTPCGSDDAASVAASPRVLADRKARRMSGMSKAMCVGLVYWGSLPGPGS
jgi:hypothetical protein